MSKSDIMVQFKLAFPFTNDSVTSNMMRGVMFEVWERCSNIKDVEIAHLKKELEKYK